MGFCPTNSVGYNYGDGDYEFNEDGPVYGPNGEWEMDPDNEQCSPINNGRPVFATCKNNCPGVNFPVVAGGFALLAGTGASGAAGVLGAGGVVTGIIAAGTMGLFG